MLPDFDIYLASASPRRAELLQQIRIRHHQIEPDLDETPLRTEAPEELVRRLASAKARAGEALVSLMPSWPRRPALGADTLVLVDDEILGKPQDASEAAHMLGQLSGRVHRVLTAVTVCLGEKSSTGYTDTRVSFRNLTDKERHLYVESGESQGKAGAYAIQGLDIMN